jgi:hypothetical protein
MGNVVDLKMAAAGDETTNPDAPQFTFADFWKLYPRRVARKDAEKAWLRIEPEIYPKIFAAVAKARTTDDWRRENGKYVPYPASYLRGERWDDELETDLTMGVCCWNQNGTREPGKPRCARPATKEKNGVVYCADHAGRVN